MALPVAQNRKYPNQWVPLHGHDDYDVGDALKLKPEVIKKVVTTGMALTPHGNMQGIPAFCKLMHSVGKTPLIGMEIYIENILNTAENHNKYSHNKKYYHLVLLAKDTQGVANLTKLASITRNYVHVIKKKYVSVLSWLDLMQYSQGLVCLSGCMGGEVSQYLKNGQRNEAKRLVDFFKTLFKDDFYLEIQRHGFKDEEIVNPALIKLARETNTPLVATPDYHYSEKSDKSTHDILYCIMDGKTLDDPTRRSLPGDDYYIYPVQVAEAKFWDILDALDNTVEIFEKCKNASLVYPKDFSEYHFPKFDTPQGISETDLLIQLCYEGFKKRYENLPHIYHNPEAKQRLDYELKTIIDMGYAGYFLIIGDLVKYARDNDIAVGPGRGSSAGSLVAYTLEITDLCPIEFNLSFERFLNVFRKAMPDIDLDFETLRREEVISRLKTKYDPQNEGKVAQIVTFGTLGAKAAFRDVAKVNGYSETFSKSIRKLIPDKPDTTFKDIMKEGTKFYKAYIDDERVRTITDTALKLEGTKTSSGRHAAAVVVADDLISSYLPTMLMYDDDTKSLRLVTQYTMTIVEELGLLKIDVLGLGTLNVKKDSINDVNILSPQTQNNRLTERTIPRYDIDVYANIFAKGETDGIFQSESKGMRTFMRNLFTTAIQYYSHLPKDVFGKMLFELLIAAISIYRPGPLQFIPQFLENIKNPNNIKYLHPALEDILKPTYGCLLYQEQVSEIAVKLAGYTPGDADILRRSMSKKKDELLAAERENFIYGKVDANGRIVIPGCINNNIPEHIASQIFDWIYEFAKYAFNKSHAGVYAVLAAETAYLKHHHPVAFMTANLNYVGEKGTSGKLPDYIRVCKSLGIKVLPPDINVSKSNFSIENNNIRFGLKGVRQLGANSTVIIEGERDSNGEYKDYLNLLGRLGSHGLDSKGVLEGLIHSGAVDCFEGSRKHKINNIEADIKASQTRATEGMSLFEIFGIKTPDNTNTNTNSTTTDEYEYKVKMAYERKFLGAFLSANPLENYEYIIKATDIQTISQITSLNTETDNIPNNVQLIGIVTDVKIEKTKKTNNEYIKYTLSDDTGTIEGAIFGYYVEQYKDFLEEGMIVYISSDLNEYAGSLSLANSRIYGVFSKDEIQSARVSNQKQLAVAYIEQELKQEQLEELYKMRTTNNGRELYIINTNSKDKYKLNFSIDLSNQHIVQFLKQNTIGLVA